jgi:Tfp pilus assembly protein PilF
MNQNQSARLALAAGTLIDEDRARAKSALEDATTRALAEVSPDMGGKWVTDAFKVDALDVLEAARRDYQRARAASTRRHRATTRSASPRSQPCT